jgi:hypothetical protein
MSVWSEFWIALQKMTMKLRSRVSEQSLYRLTHLRREGRLKNTPMNIAIPQILIAFDIELSIASHVCNEGGS